MRIDRTEIRRWIANHLSIKLIYWCIERVIRFNTTGRYADVELNKLTIMDALGKWEEQRLWE